MNSDNSQGQEPEQTPAWDTLAGISAAAGNFLQIPSVLIPFLRDEKVMEAVVDKGRLQTLMNHVHQDLHEMRRSYERLRNQHSHRSGADTDSNDLMVSIQIYQDYMEWSVQFEELVMPNVSDMLDLLQAAGANVSGVHLPRASDLA